ncbi:MAG: hypothetical protein MPEBLZ_04333 [Candidatus Methanoperedens nitroreducens]|uniref:Uncharacterized protein n=1 Tax=Candidatus Methanoperedens nitratireducens TaxID=1392998 RepID=A0A0P8AB08_9EURY|nr:hypothetical protein [Candidatus Methanoperedens sp. BLZ2]KAB2947809.1 MAG: hypothetical protein F9K14_03070 [Candidatus Methanoperedens sp.]KPQ41123.1 MAG: hypothetical protein MPEBLZ_04333 [Candidatus Methanoperedens sp. BLZ1]MBZ0175209.1 hypothetical protein [Candidatus Methanoperedens nitroreducens]MCX9076481.1 hypothetical protein [Candidatus Methanoperedens sp.]
MESLEIDDFSFGLRKINAIKTDFQMKKSEEKEHDENVKKSLPSEMSIAFKQKQDKNKIEISSYYRIPSIAEYDLEIDAEFTGLISLKEPFDIEKEDEDSTLMKELIEGKILPKLTKEMDKALNPIFRTMNIKYKSLFNKSEEDSLEF